MGGQSQNNFLRYCLEQQQQYSTFLQNVCSKMGIGLPKNNEVQLEMHLRFLFQAS